VLILGARFLYGSVTEGLAKVAADWTDVVSVNQYEVSQDLIDLFSDIAAKAGIIASGDTFADLDDMYRAAGKPMMITEYTYRAADAGLPNTLPPGFPILQTQAERADRWEWYMRQVLARPYLVGAHWFEWCDEPVGGRFDGENSNLGIVTVEDT